MIGSIDDLPHEQLDQVEREYSCAPSWFDKHNLASYDESNALHHVGVEQTFVISMGKQRWHDTLACLRDCGIDDALLWPAINGKELMKSAPVALTKSLLSPQVYLSLNRQQDDAVAYSLDKPGHIGCSLSHIGLWRNMLEQNISAALIVEDDLQLNSDIEGQLKKHQCSTVKELIAKFVQEARGVKQFDVLWLTYLSAYPVGGPEKKQNWSLNLWQTHGPGWCTQAYILTLDGARKLLEFAFPLCMGIDRYMYVRARMPSIDEKKLDFVMLRPHKNLFSHPVANMLTGSTIGYQLSPNNVISLIPNNWIATIMIGLVLLVVIMSIALIFTAIGKNKLLKQVNNQSSSDASVKQVKKS